MHMQVARKLAVVCYSAFANQGPHEAVGPDGEDPWVRAWCGQAAEAEGLAAGR